VNVRFCQSCRSLILSEFRFCPYCGAPAGRGPGLDEVLEEPFARIEEAVAPKSGAAGRFAELEAELARLEADMDCIIEELERAGGSKE
jgi:hypothetical protein